MSGRKPIIINLKATSPEGEVSHYRTIKDAAREMGFNESSIKRAYHTGRNRIGEYQLEWLEVEEEAPKRKYKNIAAKVKKEDEEMREKRGLEKLVRARESKKCSYCGMELGKQDIADFFFLLIMDKNGKVTENKTYGSLYKASQENGISLGALRNARDNMNTVIVRREDKMPFKVLWSTIHKTCFNAKKDREKAAEREESIRKKNERKAKIAKMTAEEPVEFRRKEEEERKRRGEESTKKFNKLFGPK